MLSRMPVSIREGSSRANQSAGPTLDNSGQNVTDGTVLYCTVFLACLNTCHWRRQLPAFGVLFVVSDGDKDWRIKGLGRLRRGNMAKGERITVVGSQTRDPRDPQWRGRGARPSNWRRTACAKSRDCARSLWGTMRLGPFSMSLSLFSCRNAAPWEGMLCIAINQQNSTSAMGIAPLLYCSGPLRPAYYPVGSREALAPLAMHFSKMWDVVTLD